VGVGVAIGTPQYMSPEQAAGEREIDGRSDLYSLGVVAYQMTSGVLPFNAPTIAGILMKQITEPAPVLHETQSGVPEDLSLAIARCLEKDPENRWPTADSLRRSLESKTVTGNRPGTASVRASPGPGPATRPRATGRAEVLRAREERGGELVPRSPRPLARPERGRGAAPVGGQWRKNERGEWVRTEPGELPVPDTGEPAIV